MNSLFNGKSCKKKIKKFIPSEFAKVVCRLPRAIASRMRNILNHYSESNCQQQVKARCECYCQGKDTSTLQSTRTWRQIDGVCLEYAPLQHILLPWGIWFPLDLDREQGCCSKGVKISLENGVLGLNQMLLAFHILSTHLAIPAQPPEVLNETH